LIPAKTSPSTPSGLSSRFEQERRNRPEQGCLAHARRAVRAEVACDLAAAHREADQNDVVQVEVLEERVQVGGEGVVVVADGRLARAAEPTSVVADHAVPGGEQLALLALPRVPVQRVAVDQNDGIARPVVVVVDLDVLVVLDSDVDERHDPLPIRSSSLADRWFGNSTSLR